MVITNDDSLRDSNSVSDDDDTLGITSTGQESDSSGGEGDAGTTIEVDTAELVDTAVKSIAGGLATGLVVNNLLKEE